jgi:hypothetical protein
MRASNIDVPHFGQGGRTIAREDACVENNGAEGDNRLHG